MKTGRKILMACLLCMMGTGMYAAGADNSHQVLEMHLVQTKDEGGVQTTNVQFKSTAPLARTAGLHAIAVDRAASSRICAEKTADPKDGWRDVNLPYYAGQDAVLYESDSNDSQPLQNVSAGEPLTVLARDPDNISPFCLVQDMDGRKGYVRLDALLPEEKATADCLKIWTNRPAVLYASNESGSEILETAEAGQPYIQSERTGCWAVVTNPETGQEGYMLCRDLTYINPEAGHPVVDTAPYRFEDPQTPGEEAVNYALNFIGNPYVYGGASLTEGTDCSGYTHLVWKYMGVDIQRGPAGQLQDGIEVSRDEILPGDIIIYPGHAALYIGEGRIAHATNPRDGIQVWDNAFYETPLGIRRVY